MQIILRLTLQSDLAFLGAYACLFFVCFQSFQSNITILQQINVNNVHLAYSAGIRTQNLLITSLFP